MKKCPYCAEDIQEEAVKCKHCGEFLNKTKPFKWCYKTSSLIIAFLCVGPLALPLLWINPRIGKKMKLIISLIVIILTYFIVAALISSVRTIIKYYQPMFNLNNTGF